MTAEDYFAYSREYQQRLAAAILLARAGLALPTPEDLEELDTLYDDEDPFTILEEPFVLSLQDGTARLEKGRTRT